MESYAGRFVWLEVNFDSPKNESFLATHLSSGYPFLLVIDPETGKEVRTWSGGASVVQVKDFLDSVLAKPGGGKPEEAMRRGDKLMAENDLGGAITAYDQALGYGGKDWKGKERANEQLFLALQMKGDNKVCLSRVLSDAPGMPRKHAFVSAIFIGFSCLLQAPPDENKDAGAALEKLGAEAQKLPAAGEDDVYQLYEVRWIALNRRGDRDGAHAVAVAYWDYCQSRPTSARTDDDRMARDLAKVRAAVKLGEPERVIPTLEKTEKELAYDYEASSRLATAYIAASRFDDAIATATRGLGRGPGPEASIRLLQERATAQGKKGDAAAAKTDLQAALELVAKIPTQTSRDGIGARVKHDLDALAKK